MLRVNGSPVSPPIRTRSGAPAARTHRLHPLSPLPPSTASTHCPTSYRSHSSCARGMGDTCHVSYLSRIILARCHTCHVSYLSSVILTCVYFSRVILVTCHTRLAFCRVGCRTAPSVYVYKYVSILTYIPIPYIGAVGRDSAGGVHGRAPSGRVHSAGGATEEQRQAAGPTNIAPLYTACSPCAT